MTSTREPAADGEDRVALVLDAGGARSAYQVGALDVLLPVLAERGQRPTVLIGTSAGALLSAALTATAHLDAEEQAADLVRTLGQATKRNVMRPLWRQVPVVAVRYASETLGMSRFRLRGLFGTTPLARTLAHAIDWSALHENVERGLVTTSAVAATTVRSGRVTMFTETTEPDRALPEPPAEHHRHYVQTRLGVEHLMASSAIPALFPSVRVQEPREAAGWYVDGATRRRFPLAPAIELEADRIVVVGTGSLYPPDDGPDPDLDLADVDLGDGAATLLGAVMDDPLRHDLRRFASVNAQAADPDMAPHLDRHRAARGRAAYRSLPYAAVAPHNSDELSRVAMEVFRANHGNLVRTLGDPDLQVVHRILGSDSPLQGELLSYLMFDPDFFAEAADLGRRDARRWISSDEGLWRTGPLDVSPRP